MLAQRETVKPIFEVPPQQSDYATIWAARASEMTELDQPVQRSLAFKAAKLILPAPLRKVLRSLTKRSPGGPIKGFDARHFLPVNMTGSDET